MTAEKAFSNKFEFLKQGTHSRFSNKNDCFLLLISSREIESWSIFLDLTIPIFFGIYICLGRNENWVSSNKIHDWIFIFELRFAVILSKNTFFKEYDFVPA